MNRKNFLLIAVGLVSVLNCYGMEKTFEITADHVKDIQYIEMSGVKIYSALSDKMGLITAQEDEQGTYTAAITPTIRTGKEYATDNPKELFNLLKKLYEQKEKQENNTP